MCFSLMLCVFFKNIVWVCLILYMHVCVYLLHKCTYVCVCVYLLQGYVKCVYFLILYVLPFFLLLCMNFSLMLCLCFFKYCVCVFIITLIFAICNHKKVFVKAQSFPQSGILSKTANSYLQTVIRLN